MTPEEKLLDQRYRRVFNWTLAEVDAMFALQNNRCACCGRLPGVRRLNVDHDHAFDKTKPTYSKPVLKDQQWEAYGADPRNGRDPKKNLYLWIGYGSTKSIALKNLRKIMRRASVRGGLCLRCNKGFAMFEDSKVPMSPAERFDRAATYFRHFAQKVGPDNVPNLQGVSDTLPAGGLRL